MYHAPMTEVWFRNPLTYIRECAEVLVPNISWDRGLLQKKGIDAQQHLEMHYPNAVDYRIHLTGDQGTAELRRGYPLSAPYAVYPTWAYDTGTIDELEEMLDNPVGQSLQACQNPNTPMDERPVFDQEHRVVIIRWPSGQTQMGRAFLRTLAELQDDYPEAIIHLHGGYGWRAAFGMGFGAADIDPHEDAAKGRIVLGSGKYIRHEEGIKYAQWVRLHGMSQGDLGVARNRTIFNIKSALWAGENFEKISNFKTAGLATVDPHAVTHVAPTTVRHMSRTIKAGDIDKIVCDSCSLASGCKYFRDGGVCALPDTDSAKMASMFGTRSADRIIDGLGKILSKQAERFERAADAEQWDDEGLDGEVTKLGHVIVTDGVKLAKLIDPALAAAGAPRVGVFIGAVQATPANTLTATAVAELESQGIARDDITADMLHEHITRKQQAIEARAR